MSHPQNRCPLLHHSHRLNTFKPQIKLTQLFLPLDEYVIPGNIIFRQRGTLWHPGENVGLGRDHTIYALEAGYVKYYRNPRVDPKKRYIGVVFDKTQTLPTPLNAARRRRLNMVAAPRKDIIENDTEAEIDVEEIPIQTTGQMPVTAAPSKAATKELKRRTASGLLPPSALAMMPGNYYSYRESNYSLGRAAERAGVDVKVFERGDRFLAWRKKGVRKARNAERRSLGKKKGSQRAGKRVQA